MIDVAFKFTYQGGDADRGVMDALDAETALRGIRQLLVINAHLALDEDVPSRLLTKRDSFRVVISAPSRGCWDIVAIIQLVAEKALEGAALAAGAEAWRRRDELFERARQLQKDLLEFIERVPGKDFRFGEKGADKITIRQIEAVRDMVNPLGGTGPKQLHVKPEPLSVEQAPTEEEPRSFTFDSNYVAHISEYVKELKSQSKSDDE